MLCLAAPSKFHFITQNVVGLLLLFNVRLRELFWVCKLTLCNWKDLRSEKAQVGLALSIHCFIPRIVYTQRKDDQWEKQGVIYRTSHTFDLFPLGGAAVKPTLYSTGGCLKRSYGSSKQYWSKRSRILWISICYSSDQPWYQNPYMWCFKSFTRILNVNISRSRCLSCFENHAYIFVREISQKVDVW